MNTDTANSNNINETAVSPLPNESRCKHHNRKGRCRRLVAEGRVPPRRTAVLAYITNQLLRTVTAIERKAMARSADDDGLLSIIDISRPRRDDPEKKPA